jgi:hypothetical protein
MLVAAYRRQGRCPTCVALVRSADALPTHTASRPDSNRSSGGPTGLIRANSAVIVYSGPDCRTLGGPGAWNGRLGPQSAMFGAAPQHHRLRDGRRPRWD